MNKTKILTSSDGILNRTAGKNNCMRGKMVMSSLELVSLNLSKTNPNDSDDCRISVGDGQGQGIYAWTKLTTFASDENITWCRVTWKNYGGNMFL
jgi:DUF971 family protein